jgi:hypothetical protein
MRSRVLVAAVTTFVLAVGASAAPATAVTKAELEDAWVPAMCGHPAGYLVDGELPEDDDPLNGGVWLGRTVTGQLGPDGGSWGIAQLQCNAGGVSWPDTVAFYAPNGSLHRSFYLYDITHGGREGVGLLSLHGRTASVRVVGIEQAGDPSCCGTKSAMVTFGWSKKEERVVVTGKRYYSERPVAVRLVKALNRKHFGTVRKLATRTMAADLKSMRTWANSRFRLQGCFGLLDERFPFGYDVDRACRVRVSNHYGSYRYTLGMDQRGWRTWRVSEGSYAS